MTNHQSISTVPQCVICGQKHDFKLPKHIVQELYGGRIALFAGSGISTENKMVFPYTLYEDVFGELRPKKSSSFSALMSLYCKQPNGRKKLLQKIKNRFDYIADFPELSRRATQFHRELSTIYYFDTIITTNWDDYFETECGAIPFVTAQDFVFWDTPGRKVFKIHGSIHNYGSLVVTKEDYRKSYQNLRDGLLGSFLKKIIGTKTIIYAGYSLRDEDFLKIHRLLKNELGELLPHGYIITLDKSSDKRFREMNLSPIYTDATYFLSILKAHITTSGQMLDDEAFIGIYDELMRTRYEHSKLDKYFDLSRYPDVVYASSYQDGLMHSFERMQSKMKTGYYSHICNTKNAIKSYHQIRKKKISAKRYHDVAYIDGYINGLAYLLLDKRSRKYLPRYYVYGLKDQPRSLSAFKKARRSAHITHKSSYRYAQKFVRNQLRTGLVIHHTPFLL